MLKHVIWIDFMYTHVVSLSLMNTNKPKTSISLTIPSTDYSS